MTLQLQISNPVYFESFRIDDASATWQSGKDYLLASNNATVFAIDLENAFCFALECRKNLQPWHAAAWQRYLLRIHDSPTLAVVCGDYYGLLLRNGSNYYMHSFSRSALLQPLSPAQNLGTLLVDAAFLRGAHDSIVLLFEKKLTVESCASWFTSLRIEYAAVDLAVPFSHVLTDRVSRILLYGDHHVALYSQKLVCKWQLQVETPIAQCWLSRTGLGLFCLCRDGLLQLLDCRNGESLLKAPGNIVGIPASPSAKGPTAVRPWSSESISPQTKLFLKNSVDGSNDSVYLVSQPHCGNSTHDDHVNTVTQVYTIKVVH